MDLAARCINVSRVEIDYDLLAQELKQTYDANKDRPGFFASGELSIRPAHTIEFELDTSKEFWLQYLEVFQSEDFRSGIESQVLDLVQDIGRRRMEEEVNQWL